MRKSINQFMWGYQQHFRRYVEDAADDALKAIGLPSGPRAFLVGVSTSSTQRFVACFEPETDPLAAVDLAEVTARTDDALARHPDSQMRYSDPGVHQARHLALRDRVRGEVITEALQSSGPGADLYIFVGRSGRVDGYDVHPVLAVPRTRWDSKPALSTSSVDRVPLSVSLQHAVVAEVLATATAELGQQEAPHGGFVERHETRELVRRAAQRLVESVSQLAGHHYGSELLGALDAVSAQPYEGRAGSGRILVAAVPDPDVSVVLEFADPIRVEDSRPVRKSLEMTDRSLALLCDGSSVYGLGTLGASYKAEREAAFKFEIVGRGSWELSHAGTPLLRVDNTRPALPEPRLSPDRFRDVASRIFTEIADADLDALWTLTTSASTAEHGTILVIHQDAAAEADRLMPQAQRMTPTPMGSQTLAAVTAIDGAVLVDPGGRGHAVGVILDGSATGAGDPGRGARFNSAVRYELANRGRCLVVIISEDGMVNLLPDLRRRIDPQAPERALTALEASLGELPDYEVFFRCWNAVESLEFYLNQEQCDRANAARAALEADRASNPVGITSVSWRHMRPSPEMDGSFFWRS